MVILGKFFNIKIAFCDYFQWTLVIIRELILDSFAFLDFGDALLALSLPFFEFRSSLLIAAVEGAFLQAFLKGSERAIHFSDDGFFLFLEGCNKKLNSGSDLFGNLLLFSLYVVFEKFFNVVVIGVELALLVFDD